jgi:DNA polymerase
MEVEKRLFAFPVPDREWRNWILDTMINAQGAAVDTELVESALYCDEKSTNQLMAEAVQISGLDNPKSVKQLTEWLEEEINGESEDETAAGRDAADADNGIGQAGLQAPRATVKKTVIAVDVDGVEVRGTYDAPVPTAPSGRVEIANLQKGTVKDLLEKVESEKARRMLEIRQELSKTSVKKYQSMCEAVCADGRIRGLLQFYGANRTGRDAGRLVQVQNLPQNHLPALDLARQLVKQRRIDDIRMIYGNVPDTLSQLIRTAFVAKPGSVIIPADFSAIEARIIAWLAEEKWRMDVFATHGKIYEASASSMFGVPLEEITKTHPLRQKGKIAELALGYQGAVGALITMGALKMGLTEEELRS